MQRGNSVKRVNSAICPSRVGWSSASASISQSKAGLQAIVQGWCLICLICLSRMLSQIVDWLVHKPFSVEGQMVAISLVFPFASQKRKAWSKEQMAFIKVTSAPCIGQRQPPQGNNHLNSAKPCSPPDMVCSEHGRLHVPPQAAPLSTVRRKTQAAKHFSTRHTHQQDVQLLQDPACPSGVDIPSKRTSSRILLRWHASSQLTLFVSTVIMLCIALHATTATHTFECHSEARSRYSPALCLVCLNMQWNLLLALAWQVPRQIGSEALSSG